MKPISSRNRGPIYALLFGLLLVTPLAAAWSLGPLGDLDPGMNWGTVLAAFAILGIMAMVAGTAGFVKSIPIVGPFIGKFALVVVVGSLLAMTAVNPGGFFKADATGAPAATASFAAGVYESTSDLTVYASDEVTRAALTPSASLYKPGVAEKAAIDSTGIPELAPVTLVAGKGTFEGVPVQTLGCKLDVAYSLSAYYEVVQRDIFSCREANDNGIVKVSAPPAYLRKIGTPSLAPSAATLTCANGATCSYVVKLDNSVEKTFLHQPAVKFVGTSMTLDSVDAGANCELVDIQGTQYLKFTGTSEKLGGLTTAGCPVKVTRTGATASFNLTADDLFQQYAATSFVTNGNINSATATSVYSVTVS